MDQYKAEIQRIHYDGTRHWVQVGSTRQSYDDAKNDIRLFFRHNAELGNWKVGKTRILSRSVPEWVTVTEEDVN